jgi:hypothetical protein
MQLIAKEQRGLKLPQAASDNGVLSLVRGPAGYLVSKKHAPAAARLMAKYSGLPKSTAVRTGPAA